jgi:hypothetical protein
VSFPFDPPVTDAVNSTGYIPDNEEVDCTETQLSKPENPYAVGHFNRVLKMNGERGCAIPLFT